MLAVLALYNDGWVALLCLHMHVFLHGKGHIPNNRVTLVVWTKVGTLLHNCHQYIEPQRHLLPPISHPLVVKRFSSNSFLPKAKVFFFQEGDISKTNFLE